MNIYIADTHPTSSYKPMAHGSETAVSPHKKSLVIFKAIDSFREPKLVDPYSIEAASASMIANLLQISNDNVRISIHLRGKKLTLKALLPANATSSLHQFRSFFRDAGIDLQTIHNDLSGKNLSHMNLSNAVLFNEDLHKTNLSGANLSGADLTNVNLHRANLTDANLKDTFLVGSNLQGACLSKANLQAAKLYGANLSQANLNHTNLSKTKLNRANLRDADLCGAILDKANLSEANIKGANLSGSTIRKALNWQTAVYNQNTRW